MFAKRHEPSEPNESNAPKAPNAPNELGDVVDRVFLQLANQPPETRDAMLAAMLSEGKIDSGVEAQVRRLLEMDRQASELGWLEPPLHLPLAHEGDDTATFLAEDTADVSGRKWDAAVVPQLKRYRIEKVLGEGGYGRVFAAFDTTLQESVALKVPKAALDSPLQRDVFLREAKAIWKLQRETPHPNVIRVLNADLGADDQPYIVMELVRGKGLDELLRRRGKLPWKEAVQLMVGVADGMAFAAENRIVHRDLKPANILLDEHGLPKVTDFGLAIRDDLPHHHGEIAGTWAYMAPEQVEGESQHLQSDTDVWAMGVILFQMLTGALPFRDQEQIRAGRPNRLSVRGLPDALEELCAACLAKDPQDRPAAQQLAIRLRAIVEHQPPEQPTTPLDPSRSHGSSPVDALHRPASTSKRHAMLAAIVAIIAVGGLSAWGLSFALSFAFSDGDPASSASHSEEQAVERTLTPIASSREDFYRQGEDGVIVVDSPAHLSCLQTHRPKADNYQYSADFTVSPNSGPAGVAIGIYQTETTPSKFALIRIMYDEDSKGWLRIDRCVVKRAGPGHMTLRSSEQMERIEVEKKSPGPRSLSVKIVDRTVESLMFDGREFILEVSDPVTAPPGAGCGVVAQSNVVFHQIDCKES